MSLRSFIKNKLFYLLPLYQWVISKRLKYKRQINVVFFAMTYSMWRYQHLYDVLSKCSKFKLFIVIQPTICYTQWQQEKDVAALVSYFTKRNIPYIFGSDTEGKSINIRKQLSPDILFYPQPYIGYYPESLQYNNFYDKLLCYYPYAYWTSKGDWSYNLPLHKVAWKLFYPTILHKEDAKIYSIRQGENMEIVGYPTADDFMKKNHCDLWKKQIIKKKRLIWAPHFTITKGLLYQSNFLWMSDFMIDIAQKYSGKIQFVFKPHPRLYTELCNHPDWGEEKAREYYNLWEAMENTQVETGEFVDLFMTSDAMIHDCGSFAVEYHYSENPVMYIAQNFEEQVAEKNDFGKIAMNLHYVGKTKDDIIDFIENVVLKGEDPMKPQRQQFKKDYLLPPNGKTVAENTMDVFLKAFC